MYDSLYLGALLDLILDSMPRNQLVGAELLDWPHESDMVHRIVSERTYAIARLQNAGRTDLMIVARKVVKVFPRPRV